MMLYKLFFLNSGNLFLVRYFALKKAFPEYKIQLSDLITITDTDKALFRMFLNRFRTIK